MLAVHWQGASPTSASSSEHAAHAYMATKIKTLESTLEEKEEEHAKRLRVLRQGFERVKSQHEHRLAQLEVELDAKTKKLEISEKPHMRIKELERQLDAANVQLHAMGARSAAQMAEEERALAAAREARDQSAREVEELEERIASLDAASNANSLATRVARAAGRTTVQAFVPSPCAGRR